MKKIINFKFILTATFAYIPFTVLWFFWHNNLFPGIYYSPESAENIRPIISQNIWSMNFANALLVYGFVYFYFRAITVYIRNKGDNNSDKRLSLSVMWGIYYCLSVIGFYSFLNMGILNKWNPEILVYDLVFAPIGGAFAGLLTYFLYRRFNPQIM